MALNSTVLMWATAISSEALSNRTIIFRFAEVLHPSFDRASQPDRIIIAWRYESERGQPQNEEHRRMNALEDALEPFLAKGDFGTLALVSTGENLREWTYYVRSKFEFIDNLNGALGDRPNYPIQIHTASDPDWSMYEKFLAGLSKTPPNKLH